MRCGFSRPGYLVVAESWSPNWRVSVDGEPRDLYRLNLAFQGLRVYPGDEEIRIVHQMSGSVRASLFVSAIAWFALLAVALRARCPRPS
jgi:hypothetical protein